MKLKARDVIFTVIVSIATVNMSGCANRVWAHKDGDNSNHRLQNDHMKCDMYSQSSSPMPSNNSPTYTTTTNCYSYGNCYSTSTPGVDFSGVAVAFRNLAVARKYEACMSNLGWYEVDGN